jgi:hypothetical protein
MANLILYAPPRFKRPIYISNSFETACVIANPACEVTLPNAKKVIRGDSTDFPAAYQILSNTIELYDGVVTQLYLFASANDPMLALVKSRPIYGAAYFRNTNGRYCTKRTFEKVSKLNKPKEPKDEVDTGDKP